MGFGSIVAQIVLIFIFIIVFSTLFMQHQSFVTQKSDFMTFFYQEVLPKVQTHITITELFYNDSFSVITLKNTGSTIIDPTYVDVFVNGDKVQRGDFSFIIFNQTSDPLLWNPSEALNISFSRALSGRVQYRVSTANGISAYEQLVIS